MLSLIKAQPFAKGSKRLVYVHPDNPDLCVKVPSRPDDPRCRKAQRRELRDWAWLQRWGRKAWFDRIPTIEGVVSTDLGEGIVSRLYRDEGGRIAPSMLQILRAEGLTPSLTQAIDEFEEWLRRHQLPTWDTGPHNIVAIRRRDDRWALYIVEGWVHRRCHRFPWYVHFAGDAMAERQIGKFRRRLAAFTGPADRSPDK